MTKQGSEFQSSIVKSAFCCIVTLSVFLFAQVAFAQVVLNEIQISPIADRFIEIYNSNNSDIDLTGWYIQRKTPTGASFGSLVTSTQFKDKIIKANSYFLISRAQLPDSDIVIDNLTLTEANIIRIRDSSGGNIDQIELAIVDEGKSYQRMPANQWVIATPTPRAVNTGVAALSTQEPPPSAGASATPVITPSNNSLFPIEPQIFADAGASTRVIPTGASSIFTGRVLGFKKEPIENARIVWSFGDGGRAEGVSVEHTYYYPGDYIVVLDAASGYYSASDRVAVRVAAPLLSVSTGGDVTRSFVSIENRGGDELDLSEWQIEITGKTFILPQNTILGAKKTLTLASEITGLKTPLGSVALLRFPNGTQVETKGITQSFVPTQVPVKLQEVVKQTPVTQSAGSSKKIISAQEAVVANAFVDDAIDTNQAQQEKGTLWPWYIGLAFLAALALLGLRMTREKASESPRELSADDFEIVEDEDTKDSIF